MVINQAKAFNTLPSVIVGLHEQYEAYCFNEACYYIMSEMESGKKPRFDMQKDSNEPQTLNELLEKELLEQLALEESGGDVHEH